MADPAWKPADQVDRIRVCKGPRCGREFRPAKPTQQFCSERSSAAAAIASARQKEDTPMVEPVAVEAPEHPDRAALEVLEATSNPAPADDRQCANTKCSKRFTPGRGGWSLRYCSRDCATATTKAMQTATEAAARRKPAAKPAGASATAPAGPAADTAEPSAVEGLPGGSAIEDPDETATEALRDGLRDGFAGGHLLGHNAGFHSGVQKATKLALLLMRSPTFRGLDSDVALMIVREVLS